MSNTTPRFGFYEKVNVACPANPVDGELGAVLGRSQGNDGQWNYAIHIYSHGVSFSLSEKHLVSTGEFAERQEFYDGSSMKVRVDERGRGHISDDR